MAKIRMGAMVGQISGSVGTQTYSRNRYGAYVRLRAVPVRVTKTYAQAAKNRLSTASKVWGLLDEPTRAAWRTWAQTNPITDALGDKQILDGHAACTKLNAIQLQQGGANLLVPPVTPAPVGLLTLSATVDVGTGDTELTFTPTPIGTDNKLWIWAAVVNSPGVSFVRNLYKLIQVSAVNQATGLDTKAALEARFGTLQEGQVVHYLVQVSDVNSGLQSGGYPAVCTVTDTP